MARKPFMVLFASQKGGVGKTTVALNLAVALRLQKRTVLLVDSDPESASISEQLGIKADGDGYAQLVRGEAKVSDVLFAYEPIDLNIIPGSPAEDARPLDPEQVARFYSQLKKMDYDFIIVDHPPGMVEQQSARYFDEINILTTPDPVSAEANARLADYCRKLKLEHRLLINRVGYSKYDLDKEQVENLYGDVAFQSIPEDSVVEESVSKHKPAYMIDRNSYFSIAIEELARSFLLKLSQPEGEEPATGFERESGPGFFGRFGKWVLGKG